METINNIDDLKKLPKIIESLVETEIGEKAIQLKELQNLKFRHLDIIRKLEKENNQFKKSCEQKQKLIKGYELLAKDGILEIEEDGDTWADEYGNGGGFHQVVFKYKCEVIYEEGESF